MTTTPKPKRVEKEYLFPRDVVKKFCKVISEGTLANWRARGGGPPYIKIGGRIMYRSDAVNEWILNRELESSHQKAGKRS